MLDGWMRGLGGWGSDEVIKEGFGEGTGVLS